MMLLLASVVELVDTTDLKSVAAKHMGSTPIGGTMKLDCPNCGKQHIDKGEWATREHKTHLCEYCGHLWKPFPYPTVGTEDEKEKVQKID
jgi:predicted RNA-binding Zn-ribbon protein involved in translation (DUF1610 family)